MPVCVCSLMASIVSTPLRRDHRGGVPRPGHPVGVGVGLGPSRMLAAPRPGTWFCEVTPRTPLPDLVLSFSPEDRSPVLDAFLDVVRANCPVVGAALDRRLGPRSEAAG